MLNFLEQNFEHLIYVTHLSVSQYTRKWSPGGLSLEPCQAAEVSITKQYPLMTSTIP